MFKKSLFLTLLLALLMPCAVKAQEQTLTVHDQTPTTTNSYVPFWGKWADNSLRCEMVFPSEELISMDNGTITALKFYTDGTETIPTTTGSGHWDGTFTIFMKEVASTTLTNFTGTADATIVLEAQIGLEDGEMTIEFDTPYDYHGGDLLLGVYYATGGHYKSTFFIGETASGASIYGRSGQNYSAQNGNFLPKTTFTYTPGSSQGTPKPTGLAVSNIHPTQAELDWVENGTATSWQICINNDEDNLIDVDSHPYTLPNLTPLTNYTVKVRSIGSPNSNWSASKSFSTPAIPIIVGDSWSDSFEGDNCGWELMNGSQTNQWAWGTAVSNTGTHSLYISNDGGTTHIYSNDKSFVYATKLLTFETSKYEFEYNWIAKGENNYDYLRAWLAPSTFVFTPGQLPDGTTNPYYYVSSTPDGWIPLDGGSQLNLKSTWQSFNVAKDITEGNYFLVFMWCNDGSNNYSPAGAIDNVTISRIACSHDVTGLEVATDPAPSAHTATINWTNGEPGQWEVAWSKSNSFDPANTNTEIVNTNTINLVNLESSSIYYVKVRAYCGGTDYGSWCSAVDFNTECEPITTFPWSEKFESRPANTATSYNGTYKFDDPCWLNEHLVDGTGISGSETWFQVYSGTTADNNSNRLQLPDMKDGTMTGLRLPEMNLPNNNYQFTLDIYRDNNNKVDEGIRVFASANGEIEGATELAFIPHYYNYEPKVSTYGWYTYEFPIGMSGTCYIIIRGESKYGTATYMDNFVVETIPTCKKPQKPICTTTTAHTATLSWTNGEEGQDAWQIAVGTTTDFDPSEVTPIDVTTNPATINGLLANKQYYAYIRANCGGGDYSTWSMAYASFQTTIGNSVPTGLAYDNESINSSEATVSWNSVATNDLHTSYELYYSRLSTKPEPLAADSLITGITENSYHFTGLDSEKKYYVWVRDNCGDDGLSAWSSSINFTTASNCQTPEGLTFSNITSSSITVDWIDHGTISDWNVRYSSDGGTVWTNIENATKPCQIVALTGNTEYSVQVQATCNPDPEVWSASATCRTAYSVPFTEEFSIIPTNWENKYGLLSEVMTGTALTNGSQWSFGNYNNTFNQHARINIYGANSNARKGWLITPNITLGNNYSLSFNMALTAYSAPTGYTEPYNPATDGVDDKFVVLISTNNEATWTILRQWDNAGSEYVYNDIAMTGESIYIDLAAYSGQTVRIAFYGESTENNADNNLHIDDVEINYTTTCFKPQNVTASNETNHSATITWVPGCIEQQAWQIKYSKEPDFNPDTEGTSIEVSTDPTYTFDKTLDAASDYYLYVRGNCGTTIDPDYSPWSKKCAFNTGSTAPAPTTFNNTEVGPDWVDLYWNAPAGDFLSGYGIYYATSSTAPTAETAALATINDPTAPTLESPYHLPGLTNETTYYIWIRANHESEVFSSWKAISGSSITTLPACPKPTALATSNITHTTADLTWTSYSDSYTVQKRTSGYQEAIFFDGFEDGFEDQGWTIYTLGGTLSGYSTGWLPSNDCHNGEKAAIAFSWYSGQAAIDANNWLITPQLELQGTLTFWNRIYSNSDADQFEVLLSTSGKDIDDFSTELRPMQNGNQSWTEISIDLSAYAGQTGYIAIHHVSNNHYYLIIDDFGIYGSDIPAGEWTDATTTATGGAYTLTGLTANTKYDVKVKGNCGGEFSDIHTFTTVDDHSKIFTTEGNWEVAGNWIGGIPNITENAILRANATITGIAEAKKIYFEGSPTPTLTINDGGQLKHNNAGVTATITKDITGYNEPTGRDQYYLIASPMTGSLNINSYTNLATGTYDLYSFDQSKATKEWRNYEAGEFATMKNGTGYLYANDNDIKLSITGILNPSGVPIDVDLAYTSGNRSAGWNLVGNPFACNATSSISDYYRIDATTNTLQPSSGVIAPCEGIFVKIDEEGQSVTFTRAEAVSTNNSTDGILNINLMQQATNNRSGHSRIDLARIRFGQGSQLEKLELFSDNAKIYIPQDNKNYAVVYTEDQGEMPVNFEAEENGTYTLNFSTEDVEFSYLHLIDNMTGNDINLLDTPSYTFDARTIDYASRFKLVFAKGHTDLGNDFGFFDANGNLLILGIEGTASLQVMDVTGRTISSETFSGDYSKAVNASAGVYMLRLIQGNDVRTQKIVVK